MMLNGESRKRRFVESGQNQFFLTRIGIDVPHGEDAGDAGLELLGIDLQGLLLELHAPFGDGAELRMQTEEREYVVGLDGVNRAIAALHVDAGEIGRAS